LHRLGLRHLPLLDAAGCVADLVRYELPVEPERNTPIVIMAGGLGARLRPLTNDIPKPLLKVGSRPVLETIIENFAAQGFQRITLCINYRGDMIRDHFGDGSRWDLEISYVEEPNRMGTAGALTLLPERPREPFVVMNGDLLTKVDFVRLLDFHQRQGFSATVAMREYSYQIPYGVLQINDEYQVMQMVEKPMERRYVSAGIYILNPETIDLIPRDEYYDIPTLFNALMAQNRTVGSFPLRDYWIDIGRIEDLERASAEFTEWFG
jgi:NDP-sugar pyrophosphorylase family protein